ncbi:MAG: PAS domain-containing protein [bacterium]
MQKYSTLDKLHNTNNHLSNILKTQRDIIGRITSDGTITYVNESGVNFTGISAENLIGTNFFN